MRRRNFGVRKVCSCGRSRWPRCPHSWYFSWKPKGSPRYRFSLDAEAGKHIDNRTDAEIVATNIRSAINAGTFRRMNGIAVQVVEPAGFALDAFAAAYVERVSKVSKVSWANDAGMFARLKEFRTLDGRRLGGVPLSLITEDTIESFYQSLDGFAASTRNQYVQLLKASFRWAAKRGYIARSPIADDTLKRSKIAQRRRRVSSDEEKALIEGASGSVRAGVRLQGLIIAAIESGCRVGELLALTWSDIDFNKHTLLVRAVERGAKKTGRSRLLPMSARLVAVLDMAKTDPAGRDYPSSAYVFGIFGQRVRDIKKAWETSVLRAHGHEPIWIQGRNTLSEESRALLKRIDLHFHDLRHEAGCRWLEAGWPIHHVQEMLGHANVSQTSTYLHATEQGLQESMKRFDVSRANVTQAPVTLADMAIRGKAVAKNTAIEQPPLCHDGAKNTEKDKLH